MLFKEIKELFVKELILRIYKLSLLIKVKINVLNFVLEVLESPGIPIQIG